MTAAMDANDVASYLRSHPEFFDHYADLLSQVLTPDPHNGRAVSITKRQIGALRDKNRQLEAKLAELIQFGEENDAIGEKVHSLAVELMGAKDFASVVRISYSHLAGAFAVPNVALRLWGLFPDELAGDQGELARMIEFETVSDEIEAFAAGLKQPYCGPAGKLDILPWFGERGEHVRSVALLPLRSGIETFGMLALGSEEVHRFYPEMGTLFLGQIKQLIETSLLRTLE